jgi:hypothetical protein
MEKIPFFTRMIGIKTAVAAEVGDEQPKIKWIPFLFGQIFQHPFVFFVMLTLFLGILLEVNHQVYCWRNEKNATRIQDVVHTFAEDINFSKFAEYMHSEPTIAPVEFKSEFVCTPATNVEAMKQTIEKMKTKLNTSKSGVMHSRNVGDTTCLFCIKNMNVDSLFYKKKDTTWIKCIENPILVEQSTFAKRTECSSFQPKECVHVSRPLHAVIKNGIDGAEVRLDGVNAQNALHALDMLGVDIKKKE